MVCGPSSLALSKELPFGNEKVTGDFLLGFLVTVAYKLPSMGPCVWAGLFNSIANASKSGSGLSSGIKSKFSYESHLATGS